MREADAGSQMRDRLPHGQVAFTPSFQQIGVTAPVIVLGARLLQGFSAGGEFGTATAMLIEYAPKKRRNFCGSWQNFAQATGVLLAIAMGSALTHLFTPEALETWAWRIPFLFGLLIAPVGFCIRRQMPETEAFLHRTKREPVRLGQVLSGYKRELLIALALTAAGNVMTYVLIGYLPIYAVRNLRLPASLPFDALLATVLLRAVTLPMFGHLADKIGGLRILITGQVLLLLVLYPCFYWMTSAPSMLSVMSAELVFGLLISAVSAPSPTILAGSDRQQHGAGAFLRVVLCRRHRRGYPDLKIIASHGGGTLPYLVGRFEKGDEVELPQRRQMKHKPTDYLRHIYYDSITYNLGALQYLVSVVGEEQVMLGTDWPHWVHDTKGALANTAALPGSQTRAIRGANAQRLFGL